MADKTSPEWVRAHPEYAAADMNDLGEQVEALRAQNARLRKLLEAASIGARLGGLVGLADSIDASLSVQRANGGENA